MANTPVLVPIISAPVATFILPTTTSFALGVESHLRGDGAYFMNILYKLYYRFVFVLQRLYILIVRMIVAYNNGRIWSL